MKVIIPAAGLSTRFLEAGYTILKPDLRVRRKSSTGGESGHRPRSMLNHVISSISVAHGPVIVGAHPKLVEPVDRPVVWRQVHRSRGQAHTIYKMLEDYFPQDGPVMVLNSDVVFRDGVLSQLESATLLDGADIGILVHKSESMALSYVDWFPYSQRYREKDRLSAYAMSGGWIFASAHDLRLAIEKILVAMHEPYLSQAMNLMKGVHMCHLIERKDFVDLGTPEAVEEENWEIVK